MLQRILFLFVWSVGAVALPLNAQEDAAGLHSLVPDNSIQERTSGSILYGQQVQAGNYLGSSGAASLISAWSAPLGTRWRILPLYEGNFQGINQVVPVGPGPTLVQQEADQRLSVALLSQLINEENWVRFDAGGRIQELREPNDSSLGVGLFDNWRFNAGAEWQSQPAEDLRTRLGYEYQYTDYTNYDTIASLRAFELSGKAVAQEMIGNHVLDHSDQALHAGVAGTWDALDLPWDAQYSAEYQTYPDQPIVAASGRNEASDRADWVQSADLSAGSYDRPDAPRRADAGLRLGYSRTDSNQNDYDASEGRFFSNYYSHEDVKAGAQLVLRWINLIPGRAPVRWSFDWDGLYSEYPDRVAQDASGNYHGGGVHLLSSEFSTTLAWPLAEHLFGRVTILRYDVVSNTKYDQFFQYNYTTTGYLAGVGFEF